MATLISVADPSSLEASPAAMMLPPIEGKDFDAFAEDIAKRGLRKAITLHKGRILDGRNRLRACLLLGVPPRFVEWRPKPDESPTDWVLGENVHRRQLTDQQRAFIALEAKAQYEAEGRARQLQGKRAAVDPGADRRQGTAAKPEASSRPRAAKSSQRAAEKLNISSRMVERAAKVVKDGDPELIAAVRRGDVALTPAADIARMPKEQQRELLDSPEKSELRGPINKYAMAERLRKKTKGPKLHVEALFEVLYTLRSVRGAWAMLTSKWDAQQIEKSNDTSMLPATRLSRERKIFERLDQLTRDFEEIAEAFEEPKTA